jgi:hypothetical protein
VIKAAQRLGFTLDEVADLLEVSQLRADRRADAGLQARARIKLAEVDAKLVELTALRDTLRAAWKQVATISSHAPRVSADPYLSPPPFRSESPMTKALSATRCCPPGSAPSPASGVALCRYSLPAASSVAA